MQEIFKGAGVAIVTPMKEDFSVDYDRLEELVEFHIENGTDAILICGTTGESSTLSMEEHRKAIAQTVRFAKGRIPIIAGTGSNSTETAIQHTMEAEEDGADACLIVTPYYNKATQAGLKRHYGAIAERTKLPIIVYNIPGRTGVTVQPETMAWLFEEHDNIVGEKEATGDLAIASKTMYLTDGKLQMFSGEDGLVVPLLSIGAIGVLSVVSNIAPQYMHDMIFKYFEGREAEARKMQLDIIPLVEALFCEVNPIPVKEAMNLMGMKAGKMRPPMYPMEEANLDRLKRELQRFGLLDA